MTQTTEAGGAPAETWMCSTDEERWNGSEKYTTREAAIAGAVEEFELQPNQPFWVGLVVPYKARTRGLAERILEDLAERAYHELPGDPDEIPGDWPSPSKEKLEAIDLELAALLDGLLERHGLEPTFFTIERVSEHVYEPDESGMPTGGAA